MEYNMLLQDIDVDWGRTQGAGLLAYVEHHNSKAYKRLNLHKAEFLGDGIHCMTYQVSKNRVVKLTGNPDIARANMLVKLKPHRSLCRVFDVFQIKGTELYGIRQEYLLSIISGDATTTTRYYTTNYVDKQFYPLLDLLVSYGFKGPGVSDFSDVLSPHNLFTTRSGKTVKMVDLGFLYLSTRKRNEINHKIAQL